MLRDFLMEDSDVTPTVEDIYASKIVTGSADTDSSNIATFDGAQIACDDIIYYITKRKLSFAKTGELLNLMTIYSAMKSKVPIYLVEAYNKILTLLGNFLRTRANVFVEIPCGLKKIILLDCPIYGGFLTKMEYRIKSLAKCLASIGIVDIKPPEVPKEVSSGADSKEQQFGEKLQFANEMEITQIALARDKYYCEIIRYLEKVRLQLITPL
jgi:hypothetical protein